MKKVYVDYDSCLNDMGEKWFLWMKENHGIELTNKDVLHWNYIENTYGKDMNAFWQTPDLFKDDIVMPYPVANIFMDSLRNVFGEENVFILTSSYKGTEEEKDKHIVRHFNFDPSQIIHSHDKPSYTVNSILIDDNIVTVNKHCHRNNELGIVFDKDGLNGWSKPSAILDDSITIHEELKIAKTYGNVMSQLVSQIC